MADIDDWQAEDQELVIAAEETVANGAIDALDGLVRELRSALRDERLTDAEMDSLRTYWGTALDEHLLPAIEAVYAEAYDWQMGSLTAAATSEATANARAYIETVNNRLVGVADEIFSDIQRELSQGMEAGEDADQLARRVDRVFKERGGNNWLGRASVIAQTETAAAMNAGRQQAALDYADANGLKSGITKMWITKEDDKVREAHAEAHGQTQPLTDPFIVATVEMMVPGDPTAPPELVVNCRCTARYMLSNRTASGGPIMDETTEVVPWHGILAPEGVMSGDRRKFSEGALRHRDLPLPLMYQDATQPGHDGAVRVGRIDGIQRAADEHGTTVMRAWGVMDTHDTAKEAARQLSEQMLRGVSVDVDDITIEFETEDGKPIGDPLEAMLEGEEFEEPVMVLSDGRIAGATLCSIPAFQEAFVSLGQPPGEWGVSIDSGQDESLVEVEAVVETEGFAVSDKPWSDFKESDYNDDQWYRACVLHKNGSSKVKSDNGLPIREPSGTLNRNGVHAAASRFNQVDAPAEAKSKAKAALRGAYKTLGEEVPDNLKAAQAPAFLAASALVAKGAITDFADPHLVGPTPLNVTEDGRVFGHLATWGTCHIGLDGACVTPPNSVTNYAYFTTGEVLCADGTCVPVGHITMGTGHAGPTMAARPAAEHYDNTGAVVADVAAGEDAFGIWVSGRVRPDIGDTIRGALRAAALSGDWRRIGGNLELVAALAVNVPGFPIPRTQSSLAAGAQVSLVASGIVTEPDPVLPAAALKQILTEVLREERQRQARLARAERIAASIQRDRKSRALAASGLVHR